MGRRCVWAISIQGRGYDGVIAPGRSGAADGMNAMKPGPHTNSAPRRTARLGRPRWRGVAAVLFASAWFAAVLIGCQASRLGDEPLTIDPATLPPDVRGAYTVLSSPGGYLDERSAAVESLLADGSDEANEVVAWAIEESRPRGVNQAVLQGVFASPIPPDEDLWWPIVGRADTLAPGLEDDFARALSRFDDPKFTQLLVKQAQAIDGNPVERQRVIAALGWRRTKPVAEVLVRLSDSTEPPGVRGAAFAALATLTGRTDLGEDRLAWRQWWDEVRGLDAAGWERQLTQNFVRREAAEEISTDQVVDRLREVYTTFFRLAQDKDKPRVLADMLTESLMPLRELGMTLAEQRVSAGGAFNEPLRAALRDNLTSDAADLRLRAATLLRDLADEPAADLVATRLAEGDENVDAVLRAYLVLIARMPRAQAVEPAQALLADQAMQPQAAAALAEAARAGLLSDNRAARIAKDLRNILDQNGPSPAPQLITLLGRVGNDRDFDDRIALGLDHPDTTIRRAAAQAWADSTRSLLPLAERADDPVIQPIVITAAEQRGKDPQALRTLALFPPAAGPTRDAWERAIVAMAQRVDQAQALEAAAALRNPGLAELREAVLTAALDNQASDAQPSGAYLALLLERGELRLATDRPRVAVLDFEGLVPHADRLTAPQLDRLHRGLIRAALLTNQHEKAFGVARKLFEGPNGALIQPASDDPVIDLFIQTAGEQVDQGRRTQAREILDGVRLLLGPTMKPEVALRISNVEQRATHETANGNGDNESSSRRRTTSSRDAS